MAVALQVPEGTDNQLQVSTARTDSGQVSILESRGGSDLTHTLKMCRCMISSLFFLIPSKKRARTTWAEVILMMCWYIYKNDLRYF